MYIATKKVIVVLLAMTQAIYPAFAACPGGAALPNHAGKSIVLAEDTLFFASRGLQLDDDGSPEAYGVRDQGLENICNGLAPLSPPDCRGQIHGVCYNACQTSFAAWSRSGQGPEELGKTMCAVGLGGGGCVTPVARLQAPPRQDFFVSDTGVRVSPSPGAAPTGFAATQAAQLDPAKIPYFVIPSDFRGLPWDASPGDAGVALDAASGRTAAFVVGDFGGNLDEASTALHTALRGGQAPETSLRTSALGGQVRSFESGTPGDFRIALFRHSAKRVGTSSTLMLTADSLGPWIARTAQARLVAIGGVDRIRACTK